MVELERWVLQMVGSPWVFVVVVLVLAIGSIAVFLPSQGLVVALASLLLARGDGLGASGVLVVIAAFGMVVGDAGLFVLARWANLGDHAWFNRSRVRTARESIERRYQTAPIRIAILGRLIPVGRLTTNLIGADSVLSFRRFLLACGVADVVWAAYCVGTAAALGHWSRQSPFLVTAVAVIASIVIGLAARGIVGVFTRWRARRGDVTAPRA